MLDLPALDRDPARHPLAQITLVEVETLERLAVRLLAALRLRRDLHVRGRYAERRAARGGAGPRPRPAARAARPGGAARADRPGGARGARGLAPAPHRGRPRGRPRPPPADPAPPRRPHRRRGAPSASPRATRPRRCWPSSTDERRAVKVRIAGEERWIAAEDGGLYRDALGVPVPSGLPDDFLETVPERWSPSCAATRGPTGRSRPRRLAPLRRRRRAGAEGAGARRRAGPRRAAARRHRARVVRPRRAAARPPRQPRRAPQGGRGRRRPRARPLPPSWQNVDAHRPAGAGPDRLREALVPLQGVALTPEVWERDVLPRRLGAYSQSWLDQLTTGGEIVWIGAGPSAARGRVALYFREDVRLRRAAAQQRQARPAGGRAPRRIRELLTDRPHSGSTSPRSSTTPSTRSSTPRFGIWPGPARSPTTPSRRCARRASRPRPAPRAGAPAASHRAAPRRGRRSGPLVAGLRAASGCAAGGPAPARAGRADARALRDRDPGDGALARASPAASPRSTASSRTSRSSAPPAAATSSRASAAPSSRSRVRSSGCARCRARKTSSCSSPPPTPPSPTAPSSPGRGLRLGRARTRTSRRPPAEPGSRRVRAAPRRRSA